MTTRQENTISMWQVVDHFLTNNQTIWILNLIVKACVQRLRDKQVLVDQFATKQTTKTKGATIDKANALQHAIAEGIRISGIVQAFATDTNNNTLYADMNFTKSAIKRAADTQQIIKLQFIHTTAANNLIALAPYQIDQAQLDDYQIIINQFETQITRPRNRQIIIKNATANLAATVKAGNKELKTLDKLVSIFQISHPDFYAQYFIARQIIDLGGTTTKIKIRVIDHATNAFIPDAIITNNLNEIKFITNAKGLAFGKMPFNTYNFKCTADNYTTQIINEQKVKLGQTCTLNLQLQKT